MLKLTGRLPHPVTAQWRGVLGDRTTATLSAAMEERVQWPDGAGGKRCTGSRGVWPRPVFKWAGPTVGVGASYKHTQQWVTQSWPTLSPRAPPAVATGGGWTILCTHQVHPALVQKPTVLQSQQPQVPRDSIWRQLGDQ
ncbi:uncharacterized protein LOC144150115 isoform X2 [Haemaphysalis longicornis]